MNEFDVKSNLTQSLVNLASDPYMSPFLFRTRFERCMIRLSDYAKKNQQPELFNLVCGFSIGLPRRQQSLITPGGTARQCVFRQLAFSLSQAGMQPQ